MGQQQLKNCFAKTTAFHTAGSVPCTIVTRSLAWPSGPSACPWTAADEPSMSKFRICCNPPGQPLGCEQAARRGNGSTCRSTSARAPRLFCLFWDNFISSEHFWLHIQNILGAWIIFDMIPAVSNTPAKRQKTLPHFSPCGTTANGPSKVNSAELLMTAWGIGQPDLNSLLKHPINNQKCKPNAILATKTR